MALSAVSVANCDISFWVGQHSAEAEVRNRYELMVRLAGLEWKKDKNDPQDEMLKRRLAEGLTSRKNEQLLG
jgi:hypothetical protein